MTITYEPKKLALAIKCVCRSSWGILLKHRVQTVHQLCSTVFVGVLWEDILLQLSRIWQFAKNFVQGLEGFKSLSKVRSSVSPPTRGKSPLTAPLTLLLCRFSGMQGFQSLFWGALFWEAFRLCPQFLLLCWWTKLAVDFSIYWVTLAWGRAYLL